MMSESAMGLSHEQATQLVQQVLNWFGQANGQPPHNPALLALDAVRKHPARVKCVTLAWKALDKALGDLNSRTESGSDV